MESEEVIRTLAETRFFSGLPEAVISQLAGLADMRQFGCGDVLFREGAYCGDLFLLRHGRVQLKMGVPGHGSVPILTLGPGQLVAWSAILGSGEMTASAVALEETKAFVLPGMKVTELCAVNHDFGRYFMERLADALARRLVATRLQLLDLFASESPQISVEETQHG